MEKDIATYALIKGLASTAEVLNSNPATISTLIGKPNNINTEFFKRIEEIIKCCVETMGMDLAMEYFNLSREVVEAIICSNNDCALVNRCKGMLRIVMREKITMTEEISRNEAANNAGNRNSNRGNSAALPQIDEASRSESRRGNAANNEHTPQHDAGRTDSRRNGNGAGRPPNLSAHPTNFMNTEQNRPVPMYGVIANTSLNGLVEHRPVSGNIYNPDYSYMP